MFAFVGSIRFNVWGKLWINSSALMLSYSGKLFLKGSRRSSLLNDFENLKCCFTSVLKRYRMVGPKDGRQV